MQLFQYTFNSKYKNLTTLYTCICYEKATILFLGYVSSISYHNIIILIKIYGLRSFYFSLNEQIYHA